MSSANSTLISSLPVSPNQKRKLLLIYIHGFLGSEDSFHDFPRHVHDQLTVLLSESHAVYTKLYPRYKSRGPLKIACKNFSHWLSPHEAPCLDVILLSHSMGGLLAAEVALMLEAENGLPKHKILGLINFDVPFIGLHPHVITTGLSKIFSRRKTNDVKNSPPLQDDIEALDNDENFDPPFSNDIIMTQWAGRDGVRHFLSKNSRHLSRSTLQYAFSYYDHAGCLNNYPALLERHERLCRMENVNEMNYSDGMRRVRLVNYYTSIEKAASLVRDAEPDNSISRETRTKLNELVYSMSQAESISHLPSPHKGTKMSFLGFDNSHGHSTQQTKGTESIKSAENYGMFGISSLDDDHKEAGRNRTSARKFCLVPRSCKSEIWVSLPMEATDEVEAHQSIFSRGSHYERLVGDTAQRIERWVQDELTKIAIFEPKA